MKAIQKAQNENERIRVHLCGCCLTEAVVVIVLMKGWIVRQKTSPVLSQFVRVLFSLPLIAAIAVTMAYAPVFLITKSPDWQRADPYGLLNAGVSALAFAAIIISLWHQQHELSLQRKELRLQRKDLQQSLEEYKKMAEAQESSDKRLFLTAYVNALNTLRELNSEPLMTVEGRKSSVLAAVRQRRIRINLNDLIQPMNKEASELYQPIFKPVGVQWMLERLAAAAEQLQEYIVLNEGLGTVDVDAVSELMEAVVEEIKYSYPWAAGTKYKRIENIIELSDSILEALKEPKTDLMIAGVWNRLNTLSSELHNAIEFFIINE